jgi:Phosphotransferase enzyme family
MSLEPTFHGLIWVHKGLSVEPRWSIEPDIEAIKQTLGRTRPSGTVEVTFLAQGAFNRLYDVKLDNEPYVMRVSLPVDPHYKTESEVALVNWVRRVTNIPVPRIVSYDSSRNNLIRFEWILMTKLPGRPLNEAWRSLSLAAKSRLVGELAACSCCLFRERLRGIGNVYAVVDDSLPEESGQEFHAGHTKDLPNVGRIVSMPFFWGAHIHQSIDRGPFGSSKAWLTARLALSEHDCQSTLAKHSDKHSLDSDAEADLDDATRTLRIIKGLKTVLSAIFPGHDNNSPEPSVIVHDDLSRHNILVNQDGGLAGILDWECVSALPLWKACDYPSFLQGPPRDLKPSIERYGGPSDLYLEHLWEYETTVLRPIFMHEVERLDPGWIEVYNSSQAQRDVDIAVHNCDNEFVARHIEGWTADMAGKKQNVRSLRDRIDLDY